MNKPTHANDPNALEQLKRKVQELSDQVSTLSNLVVSLSQTTHTISDIYALRCESLKGEMRQELDAIINAVTEGNLLANAAPALFLSDIAYDKKGAVWPLHQHHDDID